MATSLQKFLSSKKFFITVTSIALLVGFFLSSVLLLVLLKEALLPYFLVVFTEIAKTFTLIISVYLGVQSAIDFRSSKQNPPSE